MHIEAGAAVRALWAFEGVCSTRLGQPPLLRVCGPLNEAMHEPRQALM